MYEIKNKIKLCENDWDIYKKYTNPYEYINSVVPDIFNKSNRGHNFLEENSGQRSFASQHSDNKVAITRKVASLPDEFGQRSFASQHSEAINQENAKRSDDFGEFSGSLKYNKHMSRCVSKYKPLSRSYFKMIELLNNFIFTNNINMYRSFDNQIYNYNAPIHHDTNPMRSFHLAEGPGGFIEALVNTRKNSEDVYVGMTIVDDENEQNVPGWKKSEQFLKNNKNVTIELGEDGTGNILSIQNFLYCRNKYGSSMDLITADGGFDFSMDFNSQEQNISKLLFAQICYALCLQKMKGNFILKIFDCFIEHTVDLLYILSAFYEKVYITKPQTSRYANSEKYIVCKNFLVVNDKGVFPYLKTSFEKMLRASALKPNINTYRFLKIPISTFFITKIEEYNAIFGQQQIENIHQTITLIENKHNNDKLEVIIKSNIQKCIHWCVKYKVAYNTF